MNMRIEDILKELDHLFAQNRTGEVEQFLLRHISAAQKQQNLDIQISLYNELIGYYRSVDQTEKSMKIVTALLDLYSISGKQDSAEYGTTLLNIATACRAAGKYKEAAAFYGQAGRLYEKHLMPGDIRMAGLYNNMSIVYQESGQKARAAEYLKRALTILPEGTERAVTCTNLANLYYESGLEEDGAEYLEEALRLFEGQESDPHYASALALKAHSLSVKKEYNKSVELYTAALRNILEHFGENNAFATVCENCARVYDAAGQQQMAEKLLSRARLTRIKNGSYDKGLNGIELSRAYYDIYGRPMIKKEFAEYEERIAVGLAGQGSECFGFDDIYSRDHDYGPAFCIWLTREDYQKIGTKMQQAYERLPQSLPGYPARKESGRAGGRIGVLCTETFYEELIGSDKVPVDLRYWLHIPEHMLATAVNGEIFEDHYGAFSAIRNELGKGWPEDVRVKKIAARAAMAAQSGQYNYARCMIRQDVIAAGQCLRIFTEQIMSLCYLLSNAYMPYYKWAARGMEELEKLSEIKSYLEELSLLSLQPEEWKDVKPGAVNEADPAVRLIEKICRIIRRELKAQKLTDVEDNFLEHHVDSIMERIGDPGLRALHVMEGAL